MIKSWLAVMHAVALKESRNACHAWMKHVYLLMKQQLWAKRLMTIAQFAILKDSVKALA